MKADWKKTQKFLKYSFLFLSVVVFYFAVTLCMLVMASGYVIVSLVLYFIFAGIFIKIITLLLPGGRFYDE